MAAIPANTSSLRKHLQGIVEDPSLDLDVKLVETFTAQLADPHIPTVIPLLIPLISQVLPLLHQDPTPLVTLLKALLVPLSFSDALPFASPSTYKLLLGSDNSPIQSLGLFLLSKAIGNPGDAAAVASWNEVSKHVVETMLCSKDTGIAGEAERVLVELLKTDLPNSPGSHEEGVNMDIGGKSSPTKGGSGLLWRRIFSDKDIYETILKSCWWDGNKEEHANKTTSQGRLLGFIGKVAQMDWNTVVANPFPDLLQKYARTADTSLTSLLDYVTFGMINTEVGDILMSMLHIDFFTTLLSSTASSTKALEYFRDPRVGKHQELLTLYFYPEILVQEAYEQSFLHPAAARYVAAYVTHFPEHLVLALVTDAAIPESKHSSLKINHRTYHAIVQKWLEETSSTSSSQLTLVDVLLDRIEHYLMEGLYTKNPASSTLRLLVSLPPQILLQRNGSGDQSLVNKIPLSPPNAEYIHTLSSLLAASKQLYEFYTSHYSHLISGLPYSQSSTSTISTRKPFWSKILNYAETFALKEISLASINLILQLCKTPHWDGLSEVFEQVSIMEFILREVEIPGVNRGGLDPDSMGYKVCVLRYEIIKAVVTGLSQVGLVEPGEGGVEYIEFPARPEVERQRRLTGEGMSEEERERMLSKRKELGSKYVNHVRARLAAGVFGRGGVRLGEEQFKLGRWRCKEAIFV